MQVCNLYQKQGTPLKLNADKNPKIIAMFGFGLFDTSFPPAFKIDRPQSKSQHLPTLLEKVVARL